MGADSDGGQLRRDKDVPLRGVTSSGRVWRKVPESDAGRVGWNGLTITLTIYFTNPSGKLKLSFDRTAKNVSQ